MICGALDTSCGLSFAVSDCARMVIDHRQPPTTDRYTGGLAQTIRDLLLDNGLHAGRVSRWTVGAGPGSFSGIRVGIALLAGVCQVSAAALRGVPSSLAVAISVADRMETGRTLAVLNDARQGRLIATVYRKVHDAMIPETPATVIEPNQLETALAECTLLVSVQAGIARARLPESLAKRLVEQASVDPTALLAAAPWPATERERESSLEPVYVRPPAVAKASKPSGLGR